MRTSSRLALALLTLLGNVPAGAVVVKVGGLSAARAAGHHVIGLSLPGSNGKRQSFKIVPQAEALFTARGARVPQSRTFSSSNGPAFNLGADAKRQGRDLYVRVYTGDDARYEKGAWSPLGKLDWARVRHEQEALKRWTEEHPDLVVPVVDIGFHGERGDPDSLGYAAFSVPREDKFVSGKYVVDELDKPSPERHAALSRIIDRVEEATERLAQARIFAPKLDPTVLIDDRSGKTPLARLIKSRFDDRDPEIVRFLTEEMKRPDLVKQFISEPAALRAFYAERVRFMREQAKMLADRHAGKLEVPQEASTHADIARLLLHAAERGSRVEWTYKSEAGKVSHAVVQLDKDSPKYSGWYKGFVYILDSFGAMRRIDRIQSARLVTARK